jgi:hypothetical protein
MKMSLGRAMALAVVPVLLLTLGAGAAAAQPVSGGPPPPKGFEADSASFVSAQTGFVLGARGCSMLPCQALLEKTVNGGKTWTSVKAPKVDLVPPFTTTPASAVDAVRFENARDGWLFGPGLWATTDGGAHWHKASIKGAVVALAAADGVVYASVQPALGGLSAARLRESKVGSSAWTLVKNVRPAAALTVSGHSAWAGIAPELSTTTDSGKHWSKLPFNCPASALTPSAIAAASARDVAIACSDQSYPKPGLSIKEVFSSANGGRTFRKTAGQPAEAGQVIALALPPDHPKLITMSAASGATYFYESANGGKTWRQKTFFDGGRYFRDLAYVSATTGYVVHFSGDPFLAYTLGLMKTRNDGKTWKTIAIP